MRTEPRHRIAWLGLVAWSGLLTAVTYGSALQLPFFSDDVVHIPFVDTHSLAQIWQTGEGLLFYRPLAPTIRELLHLVLGRHDPVVQHALNLLLHVANGLMVAWLAGCLWRRQTPPSPDWRRRYLSATLFLLYPFSYQAIPWIGSVFHPLVTALVLLSLITYLRMRETGRRAWGTISLTLTLLAPFAHENGVLVGPLVAAIGLTQPARPETLRTAIGHAVLWTVPALIWLPIWWAAPKGVDESVALNSGEALLSNAIYFAQGTAYPLTWLGGWLRENIAVEASLAAALLSASGLTAAALIQWRGKADRRAWLPWLWCILAALPSVFFLRASYVLGAPRLLVLPAVGASWLWADVILRLADSGPTETARRRLGTGLAAAVCLGLMAHSYAFIRTRTTLYDIGGSATRQAIEATAAANKLGQPAIFINLPSSLAPRQTTYAVGREGVLLWPYWAAPETLVSINTGQLANIKVISNKVLKTDLPYDVTPRGAPPDWAKLDSSRGLVFETSYGADAISIRPVGTIPANAPPVSGQPVALFGAAIVLQDAQAAMDQAGLSITLTWQVREPPPQDITIFVHVLDDDGQLIAQADGDPLAKSYPLWQWPGGSSAQDRRWIAVREPGISVQVGLYSWISGERSTARSTTGVTWPDDAVPIELK